MKLNEKTTTKVSMCQFLLKRGEYAIALSFLTLLHGPVSSVKWAISIHVKSKSIMAGH